MSAHVRMRNGKGRKGEERRGKGKGAHVRLEKRIPFVGLEPTPSAFRAAVLIQLD